MSLWAPLLGVVGWSFAEDEAVHGALLAATIVVSLGFAAWRAHRRRYWLPVGVTASGCALLLAAELAGDFWPATLAGVVLLLAALLLERRIVRRFQRVSVGV